MREPIDVAVEGRRYRLRCPSIADMSRFKKAVRVAGGRRHAFGDKLLLIEAGLKAIGEAANAMDDPEIIAALEEVQGAKERVRVLIGDMQAGTMAEMDPTEFVEAINAALEVTPRLAHASDVVERSYPPYAEALADDEVYPEIAGRVALELFLDAADGLAAPVRRGFSGLSAETLGAIPASDMTHVFAAFMQAVEASEAEKKGSLLRSSGVSSRSTSKASSTPRRKSRSRSAKDGISDNGASGSSASIPNGQATPETMN